MWQDYQDIIAILEGLNTYPIIRFGYTQTAYDNDIVDGIFKLDDIEYDNSIPPQEITGTDEVIQDFSLRTNAAQITRYLMGHFWGRMSYNTSKLIQKVLSFLSENVVQRYFSVSGKVVDSINIETTASDVIITVNKSDVWYASAPVSDVPQIINITPVTAISAGMVTPETAAIIQQLKIDVEYIWSLLGPDGSLPPPQRFIDLIDTPDSYTTPPADGQFVTVDEPNEELIFSDLPEPESFYMNGTVWMNGSQWMSGTKVIDD